MGVSGEGGYKKKKLKKIKITMTIMKTILVSNITSDNIDINTDNNYEYFNLMVMTTLTMMMMMMMLTTTMTRMIMMMMMILGYRVGDDGDEFRRMRNEKLQRITIKDG